MNQVFLLCVFLFSTTLYSKSSMDQGVIKEYFKIHNEFTRQVCTPNLDGEYKKLSREYIGDGRYIPITITDKLDYGVIKNFLPLLREKATWIKGQREYLVQMHDLGGTLLSLESLRSALTNYLKERTSTKLESIKVILDQIKTESPFLLSYKFPLNHLKLRGEYDLYKNGGSEEARRRANSIFFHRKIVQDGTYDEELINSDAIYRAALDTLYLSITESIHKKKDLSDADRVDLLFVTHHFSKILKKGKKSFEYRLKEWEERTLRAIDFYQALLTDKKKLHESIITDKENTLTNLKNFVLQNEARTYSFWSTQSELMQALFVLETILYNEVGALDGGFALDRRDVAQTVLNRVNNKKYNRITVKEALYPFLEKLKTSQQNPWLNVLFKEGEFSFTYFYIPGNFSIYCPDSSRAGQYYRRQNTRIALDLLNHPNDKFKGLRYFSRVSMYGRISMDTLWNDYTALPEVPGRPLKNIARIQAAYKKGEALILYEFKNLELKKEFIVIEVNERKYVLEKDNINNIYTYRNPHLFRYFASTK